MRELRGLDLKRAQLVPSSVFSGPEEVVRHAGISPAQKLAILRRWEFDARRIEGYASTKVATRDAGLLRRVRRAIQGLLAATPVARRDSPVRPALRDGLQAGPPLGERPYQDDGALTETPRRGSAPAKLA